MSEFEEFEEKVLKFEFLRKKSTLNMKGPLLCVALGFAGARAHCSRSSLQAGIHNVTVQVGDMQRIFTVQGALHRRT